MANPRARQQDGFTLIEALVAIVILAIVLIQFLGMRTGALIDAAEARNRRIAREIAQHYLSELQAGAREVPPSSRQIVEVEEYPGFRYQVLIGEAAISDAESEAADYADLSVPAGVTSATDRLAWQRERDRLREAQARGMSMLDYEDQLRADELEDRIPSEDELEDVGIIVFFPNVRPSDDQIAETSTFVLKAKISTMAIEGLTPERAELIAEQRGGSTTAEGSGAESLVGGQR